LLRPCIRTARQGNWLGKKARNARAVEGTRFPGSRPSEDEECDEEAGAAGLIGQLGDPHYIRKANALLHHEFGGKIFSSAASHWCAFIISLVRI
jgi:hypothetical protein